MDARLTFRKQSPICWQKLRRDKFLPEGSPDTDLSIQNALVRPVSRKLARQIILKYEWLGTMFTNVDRCYGIFFGPYCGGVTTFAVSGFALPSCSKMFGLTGSELAYLARGACVHWAPNGTNSKLISWSCRLESRRGSKLVIAFADTDAGEIGTVYQASNWIYIGPGDVWRQWVSPIGRIWSFNSFTQRAKQQGFSTDEFRKRMIAAGWKEQHTNKKHRYVYLLDKKDDRLSDLIESMRKPYPKRAGSDTSDTLANHAGKGGSLPTPALPSHV
jgi:hypothetical protein